MHKLIISYNPEKLGFNIEGEKVISAQDYLTMPEYATLKGARVFNLCNEYTYQSKGYYVSLLAEARGHKPLPSVRDILDLKAPTLVRTIAEDLDDLIQRSLKNIKSEEYILSIYFGQNVATSYKELSQAFHRYFPAPFLRVKFVHNHKWTVSSAKAIAINDIPPDHFSYISRFAKEYFSKKRYDRARPKINNYSLAILTKEHDEAPPSDPKALQKLIDVANKHGFDAELISPKDMNRLPAFDALFIRMNTHVNNESYRFARRAQSEGIAIIDYPDSILKCANKVYISELLKLANVPTPKDMIIQKENRHTVIENLGLPCVLKLPDSTFSFGVKKADTKEELSTLLDQMLKHSELIIAQEYYFTDFDWRIGVLDGRAIYACKYFMAKSHWQIYNWKASKEKDQTGSFETFAVDKVPQEIINLAVKSAKLVGDGLYGVDIKEKNGTYVVIEINDNPNIDAGVEDKVLGDKLYSELIGAFKQRIEKKMGIIQ